MPGRPPDLTPRQAKAISALMTCGTVTAAAADAGVSRRTLVRWLQSETFCASLRQAQADALAASIRVMAGASVDAAELLADTVRGPAPLGMRLAAARELLRQAQTVDLVARIERLEDELSRSET